MKFRLVYEGRLTGNSAKAPKKHEIREAISPQLEKLWLIEPLSGWYQYLDSKSRKSILRQRGPYTFIPLVNKTMHLKANLDILLLRPVESGNIISQKSDLDNQVKTLIDGLRIPHGSQELDGNEYSDNIGTSVFTLLEDDSLVSGINVSTDRLLGQDNIEQALALITVEIVGSKATLDNLDLISNTIV